MMRLLLVSVGLVLVVGAVYITWPTRPVRPGRQETRAPSAAPLGPAPGAHVQAPRPTEVPAPDDILGSAFSAWAAAASQRDPRKPGYDPVRFYDPQEGDVLDLFAAEPRDEAWAQEREGDIVSQALPEFLDADHDARIEVECRTAICRVRVHSRKAMLTDRLGDYPLSCLASWTVPMWGESAADKPDAQDPYSDFYMMFGPDTRGRDGFLSRRDGTCARYRDQWRQRALR